MAFHDGRRNFGVLILLITSLAGFVIVTYNYWHTLDKSYELTEEIDKITGQIVIANDTIKTLNAMVSRIQAERTAIQAQADAAKAEIEKLKTEKQALQTDADAKVKAEQDKLKAKVDECTAACNKNVEAVKQECMKTTTTVSQPQSTSPNVAPGLFEKLGGLFGNPDQKKPSQSRESGFEDS